MEKEQLQEAIYEIELEMFVSVQNVGGKAKCQSEIDTFRVMRLSHLKTWSVELLESYLNDLQSAKAIGFNLMSEKYARMMEGTYPEEYERIKDSLPQLTDEKKELVKEVSLIIMEWEDEIRKEYPFLSRLGRPLSSKEDSPYVTSFETYTKGELSVYSLQSLRIYLKDLKDLKNKNVNGTRLIYENMVKMHGFANLEEAAMNIK